MKTSHRAAVVTLFTVLVAGTGWMWSSPSSSRGSLLAAEQMKMTAPLEVGIVCTDLDRMVGYYTSVLGLSLVGDAQTTPEMSTRLGASPDGYRIVRLQTPHGERIKLVQRKSPQGVAPPSQWAFDRMGVAYVTFVISGVDEMIKLLRSRQVPVLGDGPVEVRPGVFAAMTRDPEGNLVEFVEYAADAPGRPAGTATP